MGKIPEWTRRQDLEDARFPYWWESDFNGAAVIVRGQTDGYDVVLTPEDDQGLVEEWIVKDPVMHQEDARKRAVEWMRNHPFADESDLIERELEDQADRLANAQAAMGWTEPHMQSDEVPSDAKVFAEFGDRMAVNGELVDTRPDTTWLKSMEGHGGRVPNSEEELEVYSIVDATRKELVLPFEAVMKVAEKKWGEQDYIYRVVSGYKTIYVPE